MTLKQKYCSNHRRGFGNRSGFGVRFAEEKVSGIAISDVNEERFE